MSADLEQGVPAPRRHTLADLYHERTHFAFIERSWRWALISGVLVVIGIGALLLSGLKLGIDFEGGTSWQAKVEKGKPSVAEVRKVLAPIGLASAKVTVLEPTSGGDLPSVRVQSEVLQDPIGEVRDALAGTTGRDPADVSVSEANGGATWTVTAKKTLAESEITKALSGVTGIDPVVKVRGKNVTVKVKDTPKSPRDAVTSALADYAGAKPADVTVNTVGPTWGAQVSRKALKALVVFFLLLALYLSLRFEWKMAIAALVAVVHDIAVTVGFYAVFRFEVTPATVTAFLTILGFSLYDTVVVFDKVRDNTGSLAAIGRTTYSAMVNRSLNQVLMRSLSTTAVALIPVISLLVVGSLILGAVTLEEFALALLVGLLVGTYSSIFVASPILAWWKEREPQYAALRIRYAKAAGASERPRAPRETAPPVIGREGEGRSAPAGSATLPAGPGRAVVAKPRQPRRRKRS